MFKPSRVKQILRNGGAVTVPYIGMVPHPSVIETLGLLNYACAWVCMEHTDLGYERLSALTSAARITGLDIIVRIDKGNGGYTSIARPLEAGASGLLYPHCCSAAEARELVRNAKFAPLGMRAVSGDNADARFGLVAFEEYVRRANEETILIVQIEDKEAVDVVDEIAAVDGIDMLYVGKYDLTQSYGILGQPNHPLIYEAIDAVAAACHRRKKWWGLSAAPGDYSREMFRKGARFTCTVSDIGVLTNGFRKALEVGEADFAASKEEKE